MSKETKKEGNELIERVAKEAQSVFELNERLTNEIQTNQKVISNLSKDIQELKDVVNIPKDNKDGLDNDVVELKKQNSLLKQKLEELNYDIAKQISKKNETEKVLFSKAEVDKFRLLNNQEQFVRDINRLNKSKTELVKDLDIKERKFQQASKQLRYLQNSLKNQSNKIDALNNEISSYQKQAFRETIVKEKDEMITKLESEIGLLHQAFIEDHEHSDKLRNMIERLESKTEESDQISSQKDELVRTKDDKIYILTDLIKNKDKLIGLCSTRLEKLQESLKSLDERWQNKIDYSKKNYENVVIDQGKKITDLEKELQRKQQMKDTSDMLLEEKKKAIQLEKTLEEKKKQIDEIHGGLSDLVDDNSQNVKTLLQIEEAMRKVEQKGSKSKNSKSDDSEINKIKLIINEIKKHDKIILREKNVSKKLKLLWEKVNLEWVLKLERAQKGFKYVIVKKNEALHGLNDEINRLRRELILHKEVDSELNSKDRIIQRLKEEISMLHSAFRDNDESTKNLRVDFEQVKSSMVDNEDVLLVKDKLIAQKEKRISALKEQIENRNQLLNQGTSQVSKLKKSIKEIDRNWQTKHYTAIESFEEIIKRQNKEMEGLKKEYKTGIESDLLELTRELDTSTRANKKLKAEMDGLKDYISHLEKEVELTKKSDFHTKDSLNDLQQTIEVLKKDKEDVEKVIHQKEIILKRKDKKIGILDQQVIEKNALISDQEKHINALKEKAKDIHYDSLKHLKGEMKRYEEIIAEKDKTVRNLEKSLDEHIKSYDLTISEIKDAHDKERRIHVETIDIQDKKEIANMSMIDELKVKIKRKDKFIESLSDAVNERNKLFAMMESNKRKFMNAIVNKENEIRDSDKLHAKKDAKIRTLDANIVLIKENTKATERINKELMSKVYDNKNEISMLNEKLIKAESTISEKDSYYPMLLEMEKIELNDRIEGLVNDNTQIEMRYQLKIQELQSVIQQQENTIKQARQKQAMFIQKFQSDFSGIFNIGKNVIADADSFSSTVTELGSVSDEMKQDGVDKSQVVVEMTEGSSETIESPDEREEIRADPVTIKEILPMIDVALQHGDSIQQVKESLLAADYNENDIEEAIRIIKKS